MNTQKVRLALVTALSSLPTEAADLINNINEGLRELEIGKDPFKIETTPPTFNDHRSQVFVCQVCQTQIAINWMMIDGKASGTVTGESLKAWSFLCNNCGGECCVM